MFKAIKRKLFLINSIDKTIDDLQALEERVDELEGDITDQVSDRLENENRDLRDNVQDAYAMAEEAKDSIQNAECDIEDLQAKVKDLEDFKNMITLFLGIDDEDVDDLVEASKSTAKELNHYKQ